MPFSITGYILEPVRVGQANSPFTFTPNDYISNQTAFNIAFPSDESAPNAQYLVQVMVDGDLPDAVFGWTKNQVITRFDYDGRDQRFKTLPGKGVEILGQLGPNSNTQRLKATKPLSSNLTSFPVRVSIGTGSGTTFTIFLVLNDGLFGSPLPGVVELSESSGNLNWNTTDLVTFNGQDVRFQRQTFFGYSDSNGRLGLISDPLLLNPLPATTQYPLVRIGFGGYLTPVEVPNDAGLLPLPPSGSFKWSLATGRLAFNAGDVTVNAGKFVYYDGVLLVGTLHLTPISVGTLTVPGVLSPLPPESSDTFFRVLGVVQFPQTSFVDTLDLTGKKGTVQIRRSDGQVRFSSADRSIYGAVSVQAFIGNLLIEAGITLQVYRTPIDPAATDPTLKDVSAFYMTTNATLADPIVASPTVFLPAVPVDTDPLTITVIDKTGTPMVLPRMDVPSPPVGIGYIIDSEARNLIYVQRKVLVVVPAPLPYGAVQLPDPLVSDSNLILELETPPNSGFYVPLTLGQDVIIDSGSGTVSLVQTDGTLITSGAGGTFLANSTSFSDVGQNFVTAGVVIGDLLLVRSGASVGVYTVAVVGGPTSLTTDVPTPSAVTESNLVYEIRRGDEILADRFFKPISPLDPNTKIERILSLGTTTNSPRLSVPLNFVNPSLTRFRFGPSTFSTSVTTVANDGGFTAPSLLPVGEVEISLTTGHLNFSQTDVTAALTVYWVRTLTLSSDYTIQAPLGFIQFNDRFLAKEEALITYKAVSDPTTTIVEQGTFLVRKETTAPHPIPTNVLTFNPLGRPVTNNPPPRVFRGGRPQVNNSQVIANTVTSTITFLNDTQITNALPHGAVINPNERVLIDYFVTEAIGGEQSITVLQPPMFTGVIQTLSGLTVLGNGIHADGDSFTIPGDRTLDFVPNALLRVSGDRQELYLIGSSSFNGATNTTTVVLATPQVFLSNVSTPSLFVTSGATRIVGTPLQPAYFVTDMNPFQAVPRGSNKIRFTGDQSTVYTKGRVLHFTDGVFIDFYEVNGAKFDDTTGMTEVMLTANTVRQYTPSTILKRSVRDILEASTKTAQTAKTPDLSLPFTVFRRVDGQVGQILSQPTGFQITAAGGLTFAKTLQLNESWDILYTGFVVAQAGQSLRASYTFQIVPTDANGLLGATLLASYTTYVPDTFFYRVVSFTTFRSELAAQYTKDAQSSIPSGGPTLSNMSSPKLQDQGRESLFFQEEHLSNEDIVARATLKFYNDATNFLEDVLQDMDGRVVGDRDGRFLFDGSITNPRRMTFDQVTNQIDDQFKISPAPYTIVGPPFVVTSVGTYQAVYLPANTSRFFTTQRARYNVTAAGINDGDPILDTKSQDLTTVFGIQRRSPWATLTKTALATDSVLTVDFGTGDLGLLRPAFVNTEKVQIATPALSYATGLTIGAPPTSTTITLSAPVGVAIPAGATVFLDPSDTVYRKIYRPGFDVGVDLKGGQLTYITPSTIPITPANVSPSAGEVLDLTAQLNVDNIAPDRFPALDGVTTDDDGDRQLPLVNPDFNSEAPNLNGTHLGHLGIEKSIIRTAGPVGTLRAATTASYVDTGSLNLAGTVITASLAFPASVKVFDLVRILTGVNALAPYHQITTVLGNTITVVPAFTTDSGFSFTVTASPSLVTSTAGITSTTTTLNDVLVNFVTSGVLPGHTVVLTSGPSAGQRRQVTTVVSATSLTVTPAFSTTLAGQTYRVDNALGTFGGVGTIQAQLASELSGELGVLDTNIPPGPYAERQAIENFYNTVFNDVLASANGQTTATQPTLTDTTVNFSSVTPEDFVYIRSGSDGGVYKVQTVLTTTTLNVEALTPFPATAVGVSYRIVKSTGATKQSLQELFPILQATDLFIFVTAVFDLLVITPVAVTPDTSAFALGWLTSDLDNRESLVSARITDLDVVASPTGSVGTIQSIMSSGDRFYDQRFVWIDTRINRESGVLAKRDRAIANRIKAQADILKQLTKLLTT